MAERKWKDLPPGQEIEIDGHLLVVKAVSGDSLFLETRRDRAIVVRGVSYYVMGHINVVGGDLEIGKHGLGVSKVQRKNIHDDPSPAGRKSVEEIGIRLARKFLADNPKILKEAGLAYINNNLQRLEKDAKAKQDELDLILVEIAAVEMEEAELEAKVIGMPRSYLG